jgi:hypothetical protein
MMRGLPLGKLEKPWPDVTEMVPRSGAFVVRISMDPMAVCNPLTCPHGHAQTGRSERQADKKENGSDTGAVCRIELKGGGDWTTATARLGKTKTKRDDRSTMDSGRRFTPHELETAAEVHQRQDRGVSTVRGYRLHRDINKRLAKRLIAIVPAVRPHQGTAQGQLALRVCTRLKAKIPFPCRVPRRKVRQAPTLFSPLRRENRVDPGFRWQNHES